MSFRYLLKDASHFYIEVSNKDILNVEKPHTRGGSRRVAKFLQESILIAFDLVWKLLLSDTNFRYPSRSGILHQRYKK